MLENSSILITGGTGSFGHSFVNMTLKRYNPRRLVILSRDEMKQWEMAKLYKDDKRVMFFIGDVRDKERLVRAMKGIDYVIANAGIGGDDALFSGNSMKINNIISTNLLGVTNILMPFIPVMKKQKSGTLVCISSVAGFIPAPHHGGYTSSKAAIKMIFDSWRPTLNIFNIKAVTICPGFIDTKMVTGIGRSIPMKTAKQASERFVDVIEKGINTFIYPWPYKILIWIYYLIPKKFYNFL